MATAFENLAPRVIADLIRDFGLTPPQAAGILGNLEAESGVRAIGEAGGKGPGYGWPQWSFARRTAFMNWCRKSHVDPESYEANYGYMREELSGSIKEFNYSSTIDRLKRTATPEQAAQVFCDNYEKPNKLYAHMDRRMASARRALLLYERAKLGTSPIKEATPMDPTPIAKPWYLSKGVIGGLLAVVLPLASVAFPALRLVDPNTATDTVLKLVEILGPVIGGLLAIVGRVSAKEPIAGTHAAQNNNFAATPAAGIGSIFGLPLDTVLSELPVLISNIDGLRKNISAIPAGPAA